MDTNGNGVSEVLVQAYMCGTSGIILENLDSKYLYYFLSQHIL